jgi:hypothetical protein
MPTNSWNPSRFAPKCPSMPDDLARRLYDLISRATTTSDFHAGLREAQNRFDVIGRDVAGTAPKPLACRAGCSLCCWLRVDVFAHEVFLIAHHLQTEVDPAELARIKGNLATHAALVFPLTPFEHATRNIPCPLLKDGKCSIYAVRPNACRRQHSTDLAACQHTFDHPTDLEFPGAHDRELFRTLTLAMHYSADAYEQLGYDSTIYELGTALHEALDSPSCWQRWRAGKKAFQRASVTPAG